MIRRVDAVTLNYIIRTATLVLAVILNVMLIYEATMESPINRPKIISLAVAEVICITLATLMILNPPE